jgi:hypothetical protein
VRAAREKQRRFKFAHQNSCKKFYFCKEHKLPWDKNCQN